MSIIRVADMPTFDLPGFHFTGYTAPSRGATEICTWQIKAEPGAQSEMHWLDHEEVFLLQEGTLSLFIAGEQIEMAAGDACSVPAGQLLQVSNHGMIPATTIVCLPAGAQATGENGHLIGIPPWAK